MCKNTSNFDEHLFEELKETLDTLDSCAAFFVVSPSRTKHRGWPVGSTSRAVGRPVQARRATVQARHADKRDSVKIMPGTSRQNPGTSRSLNRCSTLQIDPKNAALVLGRHEIRFFSFEIENVALNLTLLHQFKTSLNGPKLWKMNVGFRLCFVLKQWFCHLNMWTRTSTLTRTLTFDKQFNKLHHFFVYL